MGMTLVLNKNAPVFIHKQLKKQLTILLYLCKNLVLNNTYAI